MCWCYAFDFSIGGVMIHKETFFQRAHDGLPSHTVVQYWDAVGDLQAAYFNDAEDAAEFEGELKA